MVYVIKSNDGLNYWKDSRGKDSTSSLDEAKKWKSREAALKALSRAEANIQSRHLVVEVSEDDFNHEGNAGKFKIGDTVICAVFNVSQTFQPLKMKSVKVAGQSLLHTLVVHENSDNSIFVDNKAVFRKNDDYVITIEGGYYKLFADEAELNRHVEIRRKKYLQYQVSQMDLSNDDFWKALETLIAAQGMTFEEFQEKFKSLYCETRRKQELRGVVAIHRVELCQKFAEQYSVPRSLVDSYFNKLIENQVIFVATERGTDLVCWVE